MPQTKLETRLVGMQYRTKQPLRYMIAKRLPLKVRLEREPDNKFDPNAIKVICNQAPYKDIFLGYIPRLVSEVLAPKMDTEKEYKAPLVKGAKLVGIDPLAGTGDLEIVVRRTIRLDD